MQNLNQVNSTPNLLKRLWNYFPKKRKMQFFFIFIFMLVSGLAEMISFTAIIPFLTVLTDPNKLLDIKIFNNIFNLINVKSPDQFLVPIASIFILLSIFAAIIKLSSIWISGRYAALVGSELSCNVFTKTLIQPYSAHLKKNSSSVIATNTSHVDSTILVLHQFLWFLSNFIISCLIVLGLFIINPSITSSLLLLLGLAYFILMLKVKNRLRKNSRFISIQKQKQVKIIQESLGSIRDIILDKTYRSFTDVFRNSDMNMRLKNADSIFLSVYPRNILEVIGIVFLISVSLILNFKMNFQFKETLPILGAFALGAQRLLPAMQQSYNAWATINAYSSEISKVLESLNQKTLSKFEYISQNFEPAYLNLFNNIKLKRIGFRYTQKEPFVLKNINLEFKSGDKIGIKGSTGCGKSTLLDLIMGLLIPSEGQILIDGKDIHKKNLIADWQKQITHVPQSIFLMDNSFAENIAFGIPKENIDFERVKRAAKMAYINEFIESTKYGYETFAGESGINISGGQKQRIAIARAFYRKSRIIIFDEATNALDKKTEALIMNSIYNLNSDITVIIVAHRLDILDKCDKVINLTSINI